MYNKYHTVTKKKKKTLSVVLARNLGGHRREPKLWGEKKSLNRIEEIDPLNRSRNSNTTRIFVC